ncbi:MAG: DNA translocase FtsK 4TM domain-containing protein, partial [Candidatus Binataceae bacterium]
MPREILRHGSRCSPAQDDTPVYVVFLRRRNAIARQSKTASADAKTASADGKTITADPAETPSPDARPNRIARELIALAILVLSVYAILSLVSGAFSYRPNLGGQIGAITAAGLYGAFGYAAWLLIVLMILLAAQIWREAGFDRLRHQIPGGAIVLLAICAAGGLWDAGQSASGGDIGQMIAAALFSNLNLGGGYLVIVLALIGGLALMLKRAPTELVRDLFASLPRHSRPAPRQESGDAPFYLDNPEPDDETPAVNAGTGEPARRIEFKRLAAAEKAAKPKPAKNHGAFRLPSLSLLDTPPAQHAQIDEAALERSARVLEQKLADFGVAGHVVAVQPGPVVTMYKFEPGSGIKVSQIVNLSDDLSMALRAAAVRIQAPVPGEAVVGIEVPNRKREK